MKRDAARPITAAHEVVAGPRAAGRGVGGAGLGPAGDRRVGGDDRAGSVDAEALGRIGRLQGPLELRAALLALLLPSPAAPRPADRAASLGSTPAEAGVLDDIDALPHRLRLPCLELVLDRLARRPLAERQALLATARRLMRDQGAVRPLDRLRWLAMRQRLGDRGGFGAGGPGPSEWPLLPASDVAAIAACTAHLSRTVPVDDAAGQGDAGRTWYAAVMAPWQPPADAPPRRLPDADALVNALQNVQALPWMQRPMLARAWVEAALSHGPPGLRGGLTEAAADALRLACRLLDSPLPPALASWHGSLPQDFRR